jgi:hypothetical protein
MLNRYDKYNRVYENDIRRRKEQGKRHNRNILFFYIMVGISHKAVIPVIPVTDGDCAVIDQLELLREGQEVCSPPPGGHMPKLNSGSGSIALSHARNWQVLPHCMLDHLSCQSRFSKICDITLMYKSKYVQDNICYLVTRPL